MPQIVRKYVEIGSGFSAQSVLLEDISCFSSWLPWSSGYSSSGKTDIWTGEDPKRSTGGRADEVRRARQPMLKQYIVAKGLRSPASVPLFAPLQILGARDGRLPFRLAGPPSRPHWRWRARDRARRSSFEAHRARSRRRSLAGSFDRGAPHRSADRAPWRRLSCSFWRARRGRLKGSEVYVRGPWWWP
jgi:hypothetical protein